MATPSDRLTHLPVSRSDWRIQRARDGAASVPPPRDPVLRSSERGSRDFSPLPEENDGRVIVTMLAIALFWLALGALAWWLA